MTYSVMPCPCQVGSPGKAQKNLKRQLPVTYCSKLERGMLTMGVANIFMAPLCRGYPFQGSQNRTTRVRFGLILCPRMAHVGIRQRGSALEGSDLGRLDLWGRFRQSFANHWSRPCAKLAEHERAHGPHARRRSVDK